MTTIVDRLRWCLRYGASGRGLSVSLIVLHCSICIDCCRRSCLRVRVIFICDCVDCVGVTVRVLSAHARASLGVCHLSFTCSCILKAFAFVNIFFASPALLLLIRLPTEVFCVSLNAHNTQHVLCVVVFM